MRAKRWSTGVASCVEEILDGGRGSTGPIEGDSGGPSTFDMGVPRRIEVYRMFSRRLFAFRKADDMATPTKYGVCLVSGN